MSDLARRASDLITWVVAGAAGVAAAFAPPEPTGRPGVDAVMVGAAVGALVVVGSLAPWWVLAVAAGVALSISLAPALMVAAVIALGLALWIGVGGRQRPEVLAVSAAITFNVLARAELHGFFGLTSAIAIVLGLLVFVAGIRKRSRLVRRVAWGTVGLIALFAIASTAGFGYAAVQSRHELSGGVNWAELAVTSLERGDFDEARELFASAADSLDRAHEHLSSPLALGASLVPVVAQHRDAAERMSDSGATGAAVVTEALGEIDLDELRAVDGRIDLDALAALQGPFGRVRDALTELQSVAQASRSPWLVDRATAQLDDFDESVGSHLPSLDDAITAVELAPQMLGADGPRTYLVLFTTPSESRGLGGFVGSYAELTADDGQLGLGAFGRSQDLDLLTEQAGVRVSGPDGFLERYGRFGFDKDGSGLVGGAAFRNLPMTPNFPWVGEIASDLYTQATGRNVDGVILMDPYVVASLLRYTGPIQLATLDQEISADNAAAFLLRDQYVLAADDTERTDALADAASVTFDSLLSGALPEPTTLARDFGPLVSERRFLMWSPDAAEQDLLDRVRMAGEIPPLDGADGWSFAVTNSGGNKIDSFLQRRAHYDAVTDPTTGVTTGTLRVELTNTAPADGLPNYVIGNLVGKPKGTSSLYVSFYSPLSLTAMTLDGTPTGVEVGTEVGWNVYSTNVDIPPGATVTFELQLAGQVERPEDVVTWTQPMASPVEDLG